MRLLSLLLIVVAVQCCFCCCCCSRIISYLIIDTINEYISYIPVCAYSEYLLILH